MGPFPASPLSIPTVRGKKATVTEKIGITHSVIPLFINL